MAKFAGTPGLYERCEGVIAGDVDRIIVRAEKGSQLQCVSDVRVIQRLEKVRAEELPGLLFPVKATVGVPQDHP